MKHKMAVGFRRHHFITLSLYILCMTKYQPYTLVLPDEGSQLPLIFDSPHSGSSFPEDFSSTVSPDILKTAWDAYVEDLWSEVVGMGATLLHASFPRVYIDPNRAPDDINPGDICGASELLCNPTKYSERGMGLIRQYALPNIPMYERPLNAAQIKNRLNRYYKPYHDCLKSRLESLHRQFGHVWLVDCHSMKSKGNAMNIDNGEKRPDIVLGDLSGMSVAPDFIDLVENTFVGLGYTVSRNIPYKGGYVVQKYHDTSNQFHAMQIEINRAIYMDEAAFLPNAHYDAFKRHLSEVALAICSYVRTIKTSG